MLVNIKLCVYTIFEFQNTIYVIKKTKNNRVAS